MNYKQLTEKKKVEIDVLLKQGLSMRKVAKILVDCQYFLGQIKCGQVYIALV